MQSGLQCLYMLQMVSLYQDPKGEKIFEEPATQSQSYNVKTNVTTLDASKSDFFATTTLDSTVKL